MKLLRVIRLSKPASLLVVGLVGTLFVGALVLPIARVSAAPAATAPATTPPATTVPSCSHGETGTTETPCIGLPPQNTTDNAQGANCTADCGLVAKYAIPFINFLATIVAVIVTISIVVAGIQYSSARDNPQATQAAISRITNGVIAMLSFLFLYAVLQWLVPGGFL